MILVNDNKNETTELDATYIIMRGDSYNERGTALLQSNRTLQLNDSFTRKMKEDTMLPLMRNLFHVAILIAQGRWCVTAASW